MKQTGGRWTRDVDAPIVFLVANGRHRGIALDAGTGTLLTIQEIPSIEDVIDLSERGDVMIDSGVFPFASEIAKAEGVNVNEIFVRDPDSLPGYSDLVTRYEETISLIRDSIWGYVEIDIGDADGKTETRDRLEADGFAPIPVYHALTDDVGYFDELCQEYDRVCIGNLARSPKPVRNRIVAACMTRAKEKEYDTWLHALGWGLTDAVMHYPVHSLDSVTWVKPGKYREWPIRAGAKNIGFIEDRFMTFRSSGAYWSVMALSAEQQRFAQDAAQLHSGAQALIGA